MSSSATLSASLTMSSSALPSNTPVSCATADFTKFPTSDIACAVGSTSGIANDTSSILTKCCKTAPVSPFNGANCGLYCLSVQQSVADLQKCFQDGGVKPALIFCNGNNTASASGTPRSMASPTSSGAASSPIQAGGAAPVVGVSKAGLGMLGMVIVSVFAGAML